MFINILSKALEEGAYTLAEMPEEIQHIVLENPKSNKPERPHTHKRDKRHGLKEARWEHAEKLYENGAEYSSWNSSTKKSFPLASQRRKFYGFAVDENISEALEEIWDERFLEEAGFFPW